MKLSRRQAVSLGGGVGLAALSGCASSPFSDPKLTITLLNFDSDSHVLDVEMLRPEGGEIVLQRTFELSSTDDGAAAYELQESDVIDARDYIVRASLIDNSSVSDRFRYYARCTDDEEPIEELYIEIHREEGDDEPFIQFGQNRCS